MSEVPSLRPSVEQPSGSDLVSKQTHLLALWVAGDGGFSPILRAPAKGALSLGHLPRDSRSLAT